MARKKANKDAGAPAEDARSFEEVFGELEEIVAELESGELPLEESLARFEVGLADYRRCRDILEAVERRIEILDERAEGGRRRFEVEGVEDEES